MQKYAYHLERFMDYVQDMTNDIPYNTRNCFNIFFCNEDWLDKMNCQDIDFERYINIEVNKKGLLECYWRS